MNTRHTLQALNQAITTLQTNQPKLPATLRLLADHQDTGLKATNYDTAGSTTSGHSDPTTGTTLDSDEHTELIKAIATVLTTANRINDLITNNDPNRTINTCSTCGDALAQRAAAFCTPCVNAKAQEKETCKNCNEPTLAGRRRRGRCNKCDKHMRRYGRERATTPIELTDRAVAPGEPSP